MTMSSTRVAWNPLRENAHTPASSSLAWVARPRARSGRSGGAAAVGGGGRLPGGGGPGAGSHGGPEARGSGSGPGRRPDARVSTAVRSVQLRRDPDRPTREHGSRPRAGPAPGTERGRAAAVATPPTRRSRPGPRSASAGGPGPTASTRRVGPLGPAVPVPAPRAGTGRCTSGCCSTTRPTTSSPSAARRCPGRTVVGLNHTRRGEHLPRDITHTDVDLLVTEPGHWARPGPGPAAGGRPPGAGLVPLPRAGDPEPPAGAQDLDAALAGVPATDPGYEPGPEHAWALIFTSGTSAAPKAVICTQRRLLVTGNRMRMIMDLGPDDVGYVCMPLFHSNALHGRVGAVARGRARRWRWPGASRRRGWLPDVRRYGATYFNYTGKPLAYLLAHARAARRRRQPAARRVRQRGLARGRRRVLARGSACEVIDAYGATEGGGRGQPGRRRRAPGAHRAWPVTRSRSSTRTAPSARRPGSTPDGSLLNADECVGEIVNTAGVGPVRGLLQQRRGERSGPPATAGTGPATSATSTTTGYLYFAGRNADWIRVDGENFPAGPDRGGAGPAPRRRAGRGLRRPRRAGRRPGHGRASCCATARRSTPARSPRWIDAQADLGPKWRPRYVRVAARARRPPAPTRS